VIIRKCSIFQVGSATSYSERPELNLYQERGYPEAFQSYAQPCYANAEDYLKWGQGACLPYPCQLVIYWLACRSTLNSLEN